MFPYALGDSPLAVASLHRMQHQLLMLVNRCMVLSMVFLIFLIFAPRALAVFSTPGQFSISADGSASYRIPIRVPSGTAGMAPKISLEYNSDRGNGFLGLGWGIDGLSQITRCPKTVVQDGSRGTINFDVNDRFCIDGKRLVAISGTYGGNGAEYRTELESFTKIVSYGTAGNGPAWFRVWTKGGLLFEYGNTADSRIEAQGKTTVRNWGVNKISDTKGNYLTVSYVEDSVNGEAYISRIDYTGNTGTNPVTTPFASVRFSYESRSDTTTANLSGSLIKILHRLTKISTYVGTKLIKEYRFTYVNNGNWHVNSSNAADGSLLTQVQECDGATTPTCLKPSSFGWTLGIKASASIFDNPLSKGVGNIVSAGDVNNDGFADALRYNFDGQCNTSTTTPGKFYFTKNNGGSLSSGTLFTTLYGLGGVIKLAGGGYTCSVVWPKVFYGDVNRDGYDDYIYSSPGNPTGGVSVRLSNGDGTFAAAQTWASGVAVAVGDVNGDGKADILFDTATVSATGKLKVGYSSGAGFSSVLDTGIVGSNFRCATTGTTCGGYFYVAPNVAMGDVNGDGLADLIAGSNVYLSNGSSLRAVANWGISSRIVSVGDVNDDGRADILYDTSTTSSIGTLYIGLSTGSAFVGGYPTGVNGLGYICPLTLNTSGCTNYLYAPPFAVLMDTNGDGRADLFTGDGKVRMAFTTKPDLVSTIIPGDNASHSISYQPISYPNTYTYEAGAVYPYRSTPFIAPIYVVASVSAFDGIGGNTNITYTYGGLKLDLSGWGNVGFRWMKVSSVDTGLSTTTFYRQDYPYAGLPAQVENRTGSSQLLSVIQYTYACTNPVNGAACSVAAGNRYFPYVAQSLEQSNQLNSNGSINTLATVTTANQYDSYGNATRITVTSSDGYVKDTMNTYYNDATNWILGRLLRSSVTSTTP